MIIINVKREHFLWNGKGILAHKRHPTKLIHVVLLLIIIWSNKPTIKVTCGGSNLIKAVDLRPFHNWKYSVYICIWSDMLCQYSPPICILPLATPPLLPQPLAAEADSQLPNPQFWPKNLLPHPTRCRSAKPGSSFTRAKNVPSGSWWRCSEMPDDPLLVSLEGVAVPDCLSE